MPTTAYLPEARDDIDAAYVHFESRQTGLGDRFVDELKRVVGLIESPPRVHEYVHPGLYSSRPKGLQDKMLSAS